jgi:hypothetical protein
MNIEVTDEVNSLLISTSLAESKDALSALGAAVWNFRGAYGPGDAYAVGDVVSYEGETWYRLNSNGGNVGNTPSEDAFWTILAQSGGVGGTVDDTIIDGSTNAVSGDAVFDALALKAPLASPSFTTPTLGAATATTVNKVTITAPATGATLTIADYTSITTGTGGYIDTSLGGYIKTGGYIDTSLGGSLELGPGASMGIQASIQTDAPITTNFNAPITTGLNAPIYTGLNAPISTLSGGSFATGIGNLTGPNASGTVALVNSPQTFSSLQQFSTRPRSSALLGTMSTELITLADSYYQNILNPLKAGQLDTRPFAQYYSESASAGYSLITANHTLEITTLTSPAQNTYYSYKLADSILKQAQNVWDFDRAFELFILFEMQGNTLFGTKHQIAICNNVPLGSLDIFGNVGAAVEVFNESGVTKVKLVAKSVGGTAATSSVIHSLGTTGKFVAMWLQCAGFGELSLRVVGSNSFTTLPTRPANANLTLSSELGQTQGNVNFSGYIFLTGLATSATATQNDGTVRVHKLHYHILS